MRRRGIHGLICLVSIALVSVAWLTGAAAQAASELREARVGDLILIAPASEEAELERLARVAATIMPRLERDLGHGVLAPFRIVLLPSAPRLDPELAQFDRMAPSWASGFLSGSSRIGGIRLGRLMRYPYDDTASVLAHEITHQVLYDAAGPLPRWLTEGIATWEGRRWGLRDFAVQSAALIGGRLPSLEEIDREFASSAAGARRAYAASFDFVSWSVRRYGPDFVPRLLELAADRPLGQAWSGAAGASLTSSETRWRRTTLFWHRWVPLLASSGTLWLGITGLALLAGFARRRRTQAIYGRWEAEEGSVLLAEDDVDGAAMTVDDDDQSPSRVVRFPGGRVN